MSFDVISTEILTDILSHTDDHRVTAQVCQGWYSASLYAFKDEKQARFTCLVTTILKNNQLVHEGVEQMRSGIEHYRVKMGPITQDRSLFTCKSFKEVKVRLAQLVDAVCVPIITLEGLDPQHAAAQSTLDRDVLIHTARFLAEEDFPKKAVSHAQQIRNPTSQTKALCTIIDIALAKKNVEAAIAIPDSLEPFFKLAIQPYLSRQLTQHGLFLEAEKVLIDIRDKKERMQALLVFLPALRKKWQLLVAENKVPDAIALICSLYNKEIKVSALQKLEKKLTEMGFLNKAREVHNLWNGL